MPISYKIIKKSPAFQRYLFFCSRRPVDVLTIYGIFHLSDTFVGFWVSLCSSTNRLVDGFWPLRRAARALAEAKALFIAFFLGILFFPVLTRRERLFVGLLCENLYPNWAFFFAHSECEPHFQLAFQSLNFRQFYLL